MFNLNFSNNYKVVHINNELGKCLVGGAGTYMNEMYRYRNSDTGFVNEKSLGGHISRIYDIIELINEGDYERDYVKSLS